MAQIVHDVRSVVGYEIPIASDHYGHFDLNNAIRWGRKVEPYRLAWLEDMVPGNLQINSRKCPMHWRRLY